MQVSSVAAARWLPVLALAAVLSGCGKDEGTPAVLTPASLPALPAWAKPLMGKTIQDFAASKACRGAFDTVRTRYAGTPSGVAVEGWGWLTEQKSAPLQVLFADVGGDIVGAGETVAERPDVQKVITEVTTPKVGWHGLVQATSGKITALAALPDRSLCPMGTKNVGG